MIIRFYRATVHDGQEEAFKTFLLETALPTVRTFDGLISARIGLPHESVPGEFSMVTFWRDLPALKGFTGENWRDAVVHRDEAHLLKETHVHHCHAVEE
jgi:heme-degrading monooxygenase HmoA